MMMNKRLALAFEFKAEGEQGRFTAYGNVKNVLDLAGDVSVDGAFENSIKSHERNGTMPKMLLQHDRKAVIGVWLQMKEDEKGLKLEGQLCLDTQSGRETYALMKMGALDSLSIGYVTVKESYDSKSGINYLEEVDVKEVSIVTFACNEASRVEVVKSQLAQGDLPSERELQKALQDLGFSKRKAESIINVGYKQTLDETYEQHWRISSLLYQIDVNDLGAVEQYLKSLLNHDGEKSALVVDQLKALNEQLRSKQLRGGPR